MYYSSNSNENSRYCKKKKYFQEYYITTPNFLYGKNTLYAKQHLERSKNGPKLVNLNRILN